MDQPSSPETSSIVLRIKFKSASLDEFIGRYGADVSPGGIFIRTKQPVDVGTSLQFDFTLADGSALLAGSGTVAWVRENDPARANNMPGMGLRFDKLAPESQQVHQAILAEKARREGKVLGTAQPSPAPVQIPSSAEAPKAASEEAAIPESIGEQFSARVTVIAPPPAQRMVVEDSNEFLLGGETEISDKSMVDRLREMAELEGEPSALGEAKQTGAANARLQEQNLAAASVSVKRDERPAQEPAARPTPAVGLPEMAKLVSKERPVGEEAFASLMNLDVDVAAEDSAAVPTEAVQEISGGAPLEETETEKTEPVAVAAVATEASEPTETPAQPAAFDVGKVAPESVIRTAAKQGSPRLKSKPIGKAMIVTAVVGAALAFVAVYLAKTRPWEQMSEPQVPMAVAPVAPPPIANPAPAPAPAPEPAPAAAANLGDKPAEPAPAEAPAAVDKPVHQKLAPAKTASGSEKKSVGKAEKSASKQNSSSAAGSAGKAGAKAAVNKWSEGPAPNLEDVYRLIFRSVPSGAEVLIDGDYYGRTPCDRRVLDPKKPTAILMRRDGYGSYERMLGPSDEWTQKDGEYTIRISARLKKARKAETDQGEPPAADGVDKSAPAKKEE